MGVKGLYTYLKHYRTDVLLSDPGPVLRVGVDAMSILYRFKANTEEILDFLQPLRQRGCKLFFVFDGRAPPEKEREIQNRRDAKTEAATQATSIESFLASPAAGQLDTQARELLELSLQKCQHQSWHMTRDIRRAFQDRLWEEGIPYVKSVSEADDVLIDLIGAGKLDVILTTDMDYLLGGAPRLWIPVRRGTWLLEEIQLEEVLAGESLTRGAFRDAGLLCGTEERSGARGVPCHTAFAWMRHYGSLEALLRSNVRDVGFRAMFPNEAAIHVARATRAACGPYERMRPDHLVRVQEFLDTL